MDRDGDGRVSSADATALVKKYRKTLPPYVLHGLEDAMRDKVWHM